MGDQRNMHGCIFRCRANRAGVDTGNSNPTPESFVNRRIRNSMYGGVGERQG